MTTARSCRVSGWLPAARVTMSLALASYASLATAASVAGCAIGDKEHPIVFLPARAIEELEEEHRRQQQLASMRAGCERGATRDCYQLALVLNRPSAQRAEKEEVEGCLRRACGLGDLNACEWLEQGAVYTHEFFPQGARSAAIYRPACDAGNATACERLGELYSTHEGDAAIAGPAADLYRKACTGSDGRACMLLARRLIAGEDGARGAPSVTALLQDRCGAGVAQACRGLAELADGGIGLSPDGALPAYRSACRLGDLESCMNVSLRDGRPLLAMGTRVPPAAAEELARRSGAEGAACVRRVRLLPTGEGPVDSIGFDVARRRVAYTVRERLFVADRETAETIAAYGYEALDANPLLVDPAARSALVQGRTIERFTGAWPIGARAAAVPWLRAEGYDFEGAAFDGASIFATDGTSIGRWDAVSGRRLGTTKRAGLARTVWAAAGVVAVHSTDGIEVLDAATWAPVGRVPHALGRAGPLPRSLIAVAPGGVRVAEMLRGSGGGRLWDPRSPQQPPIPIAQAWCAGPRAECRGRQVAFAPSGHTLVAVIRRSAPDPAVDLLRLTRAEDDTPVGATVVLDEALNAELVGVSSDGRTIALYLPSNPGGLALLDLDVTP